MHMDPKQDKGLIKQQLRDSERLLHAGIVGAGRYRGDSSPFASHHALILTG